MGRFGLKDAFSVRVGVGEGHFVGGDFNVGAVAGGNADVAAWILDFDSGVGWNLGIQRLEVVVVLRHAEHVEEIVVGIEIVVVAEMLEPGAGMGPPGGAESHDRKKNEESDKAAGAADRNLAAQIKRPLAEQGKSRTNQQHRPPAGVPIPEIDSGDVAGDDEQGHDADANKNDGTDDGRNTGTIGAHVVGLGSVTLRFPGFTLGAPGSLLLLAINAPLGLGVVRWIGRLAAAGRIARRYAAHDKPPSGSCPKSLELAGTMAVGGAGFWAAGCPG